MTIYDVEVTCHFKDAAERTAAVTYLMRQTYDSTANTGAGNMNTVITAANDLRTALQVLTWDEIVKTEICLIEGTDASAANIAANNQVHARTYVRDSGGFLASFDVPGWDDFTFDEDEFNLLSPAYNTAAEDVAALIKNPVTTDFMSGGVLRSVSRTHKSRGKKVV